MSHTRNDWQRRPNPTLASCCRCLRPCGDSYVVNTFQSAAMSAPAFYSYCDPCAQVIADCYGFRVKEDR